MPYIRNLRCDGASLLADIEGATGQEYDLEVSSNMVDWNVASVFTNSQPLSPVSISPALKNSQGFFRVKFSP
jgi:hypothetical protein